mmetsp:Transcript_1856/g.2856  ORF Transcript_1856/g.2856 Transcript_1856/m.2856 type:complete len:371 (+) Transcript_1856:254-1366(+)
MWGAICIVVVAAAGNNIGKVLQKQATRTLPRLQLQPAVLREYFASRMWLLGLAADLGGALLMIVAFSMAPVSLVQPVSAVGLVILLIFSHFWLKERLSQREWLAACVAFAGVLGLGASAETNHMDQTPDHLHPTRILLGFVSMVAILGVECWWRHGLHQAARAHQTSGSSSKASVSSKGAHSAALDAVLCGLEGGACFGLSAGACRTGFILARRASSWVWALVGLGGSMLLTSSGFVLQTRGLKGGNTVVVCTCAAVSSMITGVLAGLLALGEHMPTSGHMQLIRVLSWTAILLGVSTLAGGAEGLAPVGAALAALITLYAPRLPSWVRRLLPHPVAMTLQRLEKRIGAAALDELHVLPVVSTLPTSTDS